MKTESNTPQTLGVSAEQTVLQLQEQLQRMESRIHELQKTVSALETKLREAASRYVAVCPSCRTPFDMLAHHYSIGLFDNLVYVKCPKCHKALPVKGGGGGEIRVIED